MVGLTHDVFYHKPVALLMAGVGGLILGYGAPELRPEKSAPNVGIQHNTKTRSHNRGYNRFYSR